MERLVRVEFGPSRSKRFGRAVAEARSGVGECSELEPGRYRASFVLGEDPAAYAGLARVLERVRHWRATEVYEDDELVSTFHTKEMAWCASFQLTSFRACRNPSGRTQTFAASGPLTLAYVFASVLLALRKRRCCLAS